MRIRIPKGFYDDHMDRDLPAPPVLLERSRFYEIDAEHPDFGELCADCRFYCDPYGPEMGPWKSAAYALRRTLRVYDLWQEA